MSRKKPKPEDILADHSPEVRELVQRLRELVKATIPEATETAYASWHGIGYRHPQSGYFCAIFPQADDVRLGFEFGVLLPDPEGILEGTGKQVRYVHLNTAERIPVASIQPLLLAALSLPDGREAKMELIRNAARPAEE